ncbi:MAG: hypothetical protein ACRC1T_09480 [Clostridium chrysemydis]|uniref:hypothetical protein n=1 Tax=Clostridium chrysemydis TaxID=2665504 RepID=UPI003F3D8EA8
MDKLTYLIFNFAYIFSKFFFMTVWLYSTWVIFMGGEVKLTIGENGMRFGFEGIYPTLLKIINFLGK